MAFTTYRDLGPDRSLTRTAEALGRNRQTIADWSRHYGWVARAIAYDAEQDRLKLMAQQRAAVAMAERHARQAQAAQNAAMVPVTALLTRLQSIGAQNIYEAKVRDDDGEETDDLVVSHRALTELALEAIRTLPPSMGAERLARGEPTEIVQQQGVTGLVVAGPVGVERLEAVLGALAEAGVRIGVPAAHDDPDALEVAEVPEDSDA